MWLIDHQMNMRVSQEFGQYFVRLPLKKSPNIINGNALRIDWKEIIKPQELSYILGNPPFIGKHLQQDEQKNDMELIFGDIDKSGSLDYVTAWYIKAAEYIKGTQIKVAFVSTNSITQGEQVEIVWKPLIEKFGIKIHFAHRTFKWSNEAKGNAAVFVVIIGFSNFDVKNKTIWDYETPKSEAHEIIAKNINPYLVDAVDIFIPSISKPLCDVPPMIYGSKPVDDGNFLFDDKDKKEFLQKEPDAKKYIKRFISAKEHLNGEIRWCLWLKDANSIELRYLPFVKDKIEAVRKFRLNSPKKPTQEAADFSSLFAEIRQPESDYILVPQHSSETRNMFPLVSMIRAV